MMLIEKKMNLFSAGDDYYLAHCISADFALGAGIASEFSRRYDMRTKLRLKYGHGVVGTALLIDNVFNLVTKEHYYNKPFYDSLEDALKGMRFIIIEMNVVKLAMPRIGCGLDKLDWMKVRPIVEKVFEGVELEILICTL